MGPLFDALHAIPRRPLGVVVHLGAGRFALDGHDPAAIERLILVEGDPEAAAELRHAAQGVARVEVVERALAVASGPVAWHRYNLRMLNGPTDASRWSGRFPRLHLKETRTLQARSLSQLFVDLRLPDKAAPGPRVLIVDLPGQADALLGSLEGAALRHFDWVVVRDIRPGDGPTPGRGPLVDAGFAEEPLALAADPAWPVVLFRVDRHLEVVRQLGSAQRRGQELEEEVRRLREQIAAALAKADAQHKAAAEAQAALAAARKQLEEGAERHRDELASWRAKADAQHKAAAEAQAALAAARKQVAEGEAARTKLQTQLADRDARQRLLDAEVLKAEAQVALLKEVALRG